MTIGTVQLMEEKAQKRRENNAAAFQRWKARQIEAGTYKKKKEDYRMVYFTKKIENAAKSAKESILD